MGRVAKKWQEGDSLWFKIEVETVSATYAGRDPEPYLLLVIQLCLDDVLL